MKHAPGFLKITDEAKKNVNEVNVQQTIEALKNNTSAALIDVREESEFRAGHVKGAEHIGKGVIERDIERLHPNTNQPLYLYCGGGYRSALAAENLQRMGYNNVYSVEGGWAAFKDSGVETE